MKILIVRLSAFGDIIHSLPALDDLLSRPEVEEIHWLVDQRYLFVTDIFPAKVHVHTVDLKGKRPLASAWATIKTLRAIRFDAILDLQGLLKSSLLARISGQPVFGIDRDQLRERVSSWLTQPVKFHAGERHVVQQYRRVAAAPFTADPRSAPAEPLPYKQPSVQLTDRMQVAGSALTRALKLQNNQYVILHLGGGWKTKMLPDHTWTDLAKGVLKRGMTPVFSWGNHPEEVVAHRLEGQTDGAIMLPRRLETDELCGFLANARATIGADTGIQHLAAAVDTPTATFWGPSARWRSGSLDEKHRHAEAGTVCGPCFQRNCNQFICMDQICANDLLRILHD